MNLGILHGLVDKTATTLNIDDRSWVMVDRAPLGRGVPSLYLVQLEAMHLARAG